MYYDYEDEYEPTQEELEENDGMENTEVKVEKEKIRIEFNTENFATGIMMAVVEEVRKNIYRGVVDEIKKEVMEGIKEKIKDSTHSIVREILDDYVENEIITIGSNSPWDDTPKEELTIKQYMKRCVKECIESGKFRVPTGEKTTRGDKYKEYGFMEYVNEHLKMDSDIKKYLDASIDEVRKRVNSDVKAAFDESTKTMLSNAVLQVLMANDTYKKIESNIACIADRQQE